ncbi:MAG: hypothetical protein HY359_05780 [Candidatus Rokubacteria bacterium]|nr:hypothetical protein [Candidatus Rokubacteria bacterium]
MRLGPRRPALLLALLLAGCAAGPRVVPVPAPGVEVEPRTSAAAAADGVQIVVRPSAWQGRPAYLPSYVTPFHLLIVNGSALPIGYDYGDLRLFDEARFQYTALPPADVGRLLRWGEGEPEVRLAAAGAAVAPLHWRHRPLFWDPWWDPWWGGPPYYPSWPYAPPRVDDVLTQALPVGTLQPGARLQGYVYFPRLRREARRLTFEFHYRLGDAPRVLTLPFAVERATGAGTTAARA